MTDKDDLVKRLKLAAKGAEERGFGWSPELIREAADALEEARRDSDHFFQLSGRYLEELSRSRDEALEEAAKECESYNLGESGRNVMRAAKAIRALKIAAPQGEG